MVARRQTRRFSVTPLARLALAVVGGYLTYASYEPNGWWFLALVGIALLVGALMPWREPVSKRWGALIGFSYGLGLYLPLLPWVGEFVGAIAWVALAITQSLYFLPFGFAAAAIARHRHLAAPGLALWFVAAEYLRSNWPFGGFAWGRIAWGQVNGPLAWWASVGGPALVTFAVVLVGAWLAATVRYRAWGTALSAVVIIGLSVIFPHISPNPPDAGSIKIAAIQGNVPRMGLDFNAQRRAVLANHARVTEQLSEPVDAIIWPENSSDVNPFSDKEARALIDAAVRKAGAPTLVGTITVDEVGPRNTMVVFNPDGSVGEHHYKKFLQPFGEYMPYRDFFRKFSSYVDMAGNFQAGTGTGVVTLGETPVGVATCYEVAFDAAGRTAVDNGAQLLTTPTNNATFGFTDMTYQQMAMSRMRAIELDRAVVIAATSGSSAMIRPDGSVIEKTEIFRPATLVAELPLRTTRTIASQFGHIIELTLVGLGIATALAAILVTRKDR